MKNLYIKYFTGILTILCLSTMPGYSQSVELGARLMPVFSSFNFHTASGGTVKGETTVGFGFGGFLGVNLTKHVGIQGEVIYNSLLQKYNENTTSRDITVRYLNIPILLSLNTNKQSFINLNAVAGPQIGIRQSSKINSTSNDGVTSAQGVLAIKKNDLGLAYGAGVDFGLGLKKMIRIGLGFRGVLGIVDISDNSETLTTGNYYILDRTRIKTYSIYGGLSILL